MDRLFFKYLAPLLAISIIPTLAIVLMLFFFIRNNINVLEQNLVRQEAEALSRLVSEKNQALAKTEGMYIEQEIDKIREKLKAMRLASDFIAMNYDNVNGYIDNLFAREPSITEMMLVDERGKLISQKFSSLSLEADETVDVSEDVIFSKLEKRQSYISLPEISHFTQMPYITMGEPIINSAGSFTGGIIVKLDLGFVRDIVSTKKIGESGFLFIVSEKGKLISHPSLREYYQNEDYSKYEHINEILEKKNGSVWDDERFVSFYTNKYGWTTVVEMPSKEAFAIADYNKQMIRSFINVTLNNLAYFTVIIILFGFIIATAVTVFFTKRILSPLLNLTNAARRISQGEFTMKIEKQSNDELGEFTDSFNKMSEELKKEREELIKSNEFIRNQAQEIIEKYLAESRQPAMKHISELEKPLLRVKNYLAEIIKQKKESGMTDQAGEVMEDVEQIDAFLKDLFEHSKITPDFSNFTPVDFSEACAAAAQKLKKDLEKNAAAVHYEKLPVLKALRMSILQLFENLFSNAIKYRSDQPLVITIAAKENGSEWQFSVSDNGIGIDPEEISDIFQVRENHENGNYKFNFGLAMCKNIVERHGGKMWAESRKGAGSVFYFTIRKL